MRSGLGRMNLQTSTHRNCKFRESDRLQTGELPLCATGISFQWIRPRERFLWTRKGVERESQLFGDQQLIMVLPPGQKEVQVLSAIDGRLLGVREVPAEKDCWTTVGSPHSGVAKSSWGGGPTGNWPFTIPGHKKMCGRTP